MNPEELERYLYDSIPLVSAMKISVASVTDDGVVIEAPLAPNINQHNTLFGGAASTIAVLAGWSLVFTRMCREDVAGHIVIQRHTMQYDQPVHGDFAVRSFLAPQADWPLFVSRLGERGMARIPVHAELEYQGKRAGRLTGDFVAINRPSQG